MKKLFIVLSTLSLLLVAFVACNDNDLPIDQSTQENVMELRSTGADATHYYWFRGERIALAVNKDYVHVIVNDGFLESANSSSLFQTFNIEQDDSDQTQGMIRLKLTPEGSKSRSGSALSAYLETVDVLKQSGKISYVFPFFERGEGATPIGTSDVFYLKLKTPEDMAKLKEVTERHSVQIIKQIPYMPLWYILSVQGSGFRNSIEASNYFFETGYFSEIDPAFMFNFAPGCVNDPMFNQQWGLRNTGQSGGRSGIDINICPAWAITRGAGANVAVVDRGIYPNHNDLTPFHSLSFDAQSGQPGSIFTTTGVDFGHGTHVAGIIAARNNGLQVVGVAPESRIMRISHGLRATSTASAELASGISWAWRSGADVINNSWGDQGGVAFNTLRSAVLENAIDSAIVRGRGGLGTVVVFTSGNFGSIDYPAWSRPDILVVGAVDRHGRRSVFSGGSSGFGTQLDIVAPGSDILSTGPNNSTFFDSGTSMAAPHVAGVAALMLSVNPALTGQQVRNIIKSTANKNLPGVTFATTPGRPNGTWNSHVGHGLVNAFRAVEQVAPKVSGPTHFCTSVTYSITPALPAGWSVAWTVKRTRDDSWSVTTTTQTFTTPTITLSGGNFSDFLEISATVRNASGAIIATPTFSATNGTPTPYTGTLNMRYLSQGSFHSALSNHWTQTTVHLTQPLTTLHLDNFNDFARNWHTNVHFTHVEVGGDVAGLVNVNFHPQFLEISAQSSWNHSEVTGYLDIRLESPCGIGNRAFRIFLQVSPFIPFAGFNTSVSSDRGALIVEVGARGTDGNISPDSSREFSSTYDIRLYSKRGDLLKQQITRSSTIEFDIAELPDGVYFIHLYDGINTGPHIRSIVIENSAELTF
jgi:subtilisin family serine protease